VAGYRSRWWLKYDWIGRLEEAILGVSVKISQNSDAPVLYGVANLFLNFVG
jgi:hypothetical protein